MSKSEKHGMRRQNGRAAGKRAKTNFKGVTNHLQASMKESRKGLEVRKALRTCARMTSGGEWFFATASSSTYFWRLALRRQWVNFCSVGVNSANPGVCFRMSSVLVVVGVQREIQCFFLGGSYEERFKDKKGWNSFFSNAYCLWSIHIKMTLIACF